jgi:hypothetical protein
LPDAIKDLLKAQKDYRMKKKTLKGGDREKQVTAC